MRQLDWNVAGEDRASPLAAFRDDVLPGEDLLEAGMSEEDEGLIVA